MVVVVVAAVVVVVVVVVVVEEVELLEVLDAGTVDDGTVDDGTDDAATSGAALTGSGGVSATVAVSDSGGRASGAWLSTVVVHAASNVAEAAIHILVRRVVTCDNVPSLDQLVPAGETLE